MRSMPPSGRSTRIGPASNSSHWSSASFISFASFPSFPSLAAVATVDTVGWLDSLQSERSTGFSSTLGSPSSTLEMATVLLLASVKVSGPPAWSEPDKAWPVGADGSDEVDSVDRARLTLPAPRGPAPSVHATKANVAKITMGMARWFCMDASQTGWTTRIAPEQAEPVPRRLPCRPQGIALQRRVRWLKTSHAGAACDTAAVWGGVGCRGLCPTQGRV